MTLYPVEPWQYCRVMVLFTEASFPTEQSVTDSRVLDHFCARGNHTIDMEKNWVPFTLAQLLS